MTIAERFEAMDYGPAPESRAEADAWLAGRDLCAALFIDGRWKQASSAATFAVFNPADGAQLAAVSHATADDVDSAVAAARKALPQWRSTPGYERARLLYAIGRAMQRHARLLAVLESLDNGKPIRESRDIDVPLAIRHFIHHAGWAQSLGDEFPGMAGIGVAGQIIPWNFPLLMLAWKVAPALAAGCTIVLKPAEQTPLTAILFAEICQRAGIPKGVINIVHGGPDVGAAIVEHDGIDKIAFTGSCEIGKLIRRRTAGTGKKLSLELGGKSAFIVFEDADQDSAIEGLVDGIWFNQGQVCCAGSRLLVQEGIATAFLARLRERMAALRVGDPLDKNTDIGPLVDKTQLERVSALVAQGEAEGAICWRPPTTLPPTGHYHPPVLATDLGPANVLAREEVFGPVLAAMTFRTAPEAVELANNTRFGLAASVWSETIDRALDVAPKLKAGVVWINGTNMLDAACGFGGYRESGFGREGGYEGMLEYLAPARRPAKPTAIPVQEPLSGARTRGDGDGAFIDRTAKFFIGGKQARPDGGYAYSVDDAKGRFSGEAGLGNRKDVREAVSAARGCGAWPTATAHNRAQVLFFLAENLAARGEEFAARIASLTGASAKTAGAEVDMALERIFAAAGMADKFEGRVHQPPMRAVTLAMNEPLGVIGVIAPPERPLLGLVAMIAPALAMGNCVVAVPSAPHALVATDLYQVFETSDLPAGSINIVTGHQGELARVLAAHDDVDGLWCAADADTCRAVEEQSAGNLKRTWTSRGNAIDWKDETAGTKSWLRRASEMKNIWVPYGD